MKEKRQAKILELIKHHNVETQEELCALLQEAGFHVTQATVSRDIRELKLSKIAEKGGHQKYVSIHGGESILGDRLTSVFRHSMVSMEPAQNILVIKTVSGMAMAMATSLDALNAEEVIGVIAGDDTIFVATKSNEEAVALQKKLEGFMH